jgi:hypothetical protein
MRWGFIFRVARGAVVTAVTAVTVVGVMEILKRDGRELKLLCSSLAVSVLRAERMRCGWEQYRSLEAACAQDLELASPRAEERWIRWGVA